MSDDHHADIWLRNIVQSQRRNIWTLFLVMFSASVLAAQENNERKIMFNRQSIDSLDVNDTRDRFVVLDSNGFVGVLDAYDSKSKFVKCHVEASSKVKFSSDGKLIYVVRSDRKVTVLDSVTLKELKTVPFPEGRCDKITIVGNIWILESGEKDKLTRVYSEENFAFRHIINLEGKYVSNTTGAMGSVNTLKMLFDNGALIEFNPKTRFVSATVTKFISDKTNDLSMGLLSPDGKYVFAFGAKTRRYASVAAANPKWNEINDANLIFESILFVDSRYFIVDTLIGSDLKDIESGNSVGRVYYPDQVRYLKALSKPGYLVGGTDDGDIYIFKVPIPKK